MPSVNIYVSDKMKARMDKVGERTNWSTVAQRAFDVELNHLETVKEIGSMNDVIERLRASKNEFAVKSVGDGRECGANWAMTRARFEDLKRLAVLEDELYSYHDAMTDDEDAGRKFATHLFREVFAEEHKPDDNNLAAFLGVEPEAIAHLPLTFVDGFIEGATEVWAEVVNKL